MLKCIRFNFRLCRRLPKNGFLYGSNQARFTTLIDSAPLHDSPLHDPAPSHDSTPSQNSAPLHETSTNVKQFVPRIYQEECCKTISSAFQTHSRVGIAIPTGGGKTMILTTIAKQFLDKNPNKKVLIVVYSRDAISQMVETAERIIPQAKVGVEAARQEASLDSDIIVASVHTLRNEYRLSKFNPTDFCLIICDEVHRGVAPSYLKLWEYFGCYGQKSSDIPFLGVSATLERHDKVKLSNILDKIVYQKSLNDLISSNHLCDMKLTVVEADQDFGQCIGIDGTQRSFTQIEQILDTPSTHEVVFQTWRYHSTTENRKATLIFACNVSHCFNLANHFRALGVDVEVIVGNTPHDKRDDILTRFRAGELPVLIANECLKEAVDLPRTDMIILLHPTRSKVMVVQMVGRGLRLHPDKKDCHVIDMVNVVQTCGGLVSIPTLAGRDIPEPKELSDDYEEIRKQKVPGSPSIPVEVRKLAYETFGDFAEYLESSLHTTSDSDINKILSDGSLDGLTPHNWLNIGGDTYILQGRHEFLKVYPNNKEKTVSKDETRKIEYRAARCWLQRTDEKVYQRYDVVEQTFPTLQDAIAYLDDYACKRYPLLLIDRDQCWRKAPITSRQKQTIQQKFASILKMKKFAGRQLDPDKLNKLNRGQAVDLTVLGKLRKYDKLYPLTKSTEE